MNKHKTISGFAILAIAIIIGGGILWISVTYANQQRDNALHAALARQRASLINGCVRGNKLRVRLNNTIRVEHDFLVAARIARIAPVKTKYIQQLVEIPLVNCEEAYPR